MRQLKWIKWLKLEQKLQSWSTLPQTRTQLALHKALVVGTTVKEIRIVRSPYRTRSGHWATKTERWTSTLVICRALQLRMGIPYSIPFQIPFQTRNSFPFQGNPIWSGGIPDLENKKIWKIEAWNSWSSVWNSSLWWKVTLGRYGKPVNRYSVSSTWLRVLRLMNRNTYSSVQCSKCTYTVRLIMVLVVLVLYIVCTTQ